MPDAFAPGPSQPTVSPVFAGAALLDAEKLDVYRVALEMARGSATGCAAILDLLGARGLVDDRLRKRARSLIVRVVQMLTRLVARIAAPSV